ncbi:MAG TPA: hypothetical protein VFV38_14835 [Ktedonobacteraceae bacterium]|nr:hypothetical protein [Ktedonobacteraceae bacterium]
MGEYKRRFAQIVLEATALTGLGEGRCLFTSKHGQLLLASHGLFVRNLTT